MVSLGIWYCIYNMSNIEHTPQTPKDYNEEISQALKLGNAGQEMTPREKQLLEETIQASRNMVLNGPPVPARQETSPKEPEAASRSRRGRNAAGATAALLGTTLALVGVDHLANGEPEFSKETTTYTVGQGDGVFDAAQEIEGLRDMNYGISHIKADPANIDVLKDGLQPGEQLVIPVSVAGYDKDKK